MSNLLNLRGQRYDQVISFAYSLDFTYFNLNILIELITILVYRFQKMWEFEAIYRYFQFGIENPIISLVIVYYLVSLIIKSFCSFYS